MRRVDRLLEEYGESHRNRTNKVIHWIFVPLIFLSIALLIWSIPFPFGDHWWFNWISLAIALVTSYYLFLSPMIALGIFPIMILCIYVARFLDRTFDIPVWGIALLIFIISWVFQFVGHKIEGKKPSFLKDLQFLLVGPAWLMHFIYKRIGIPY
ncbi:MAG: DUF962 domain-containing protein [Candidatus Omnitrophica bacterium]|nr:DUF962 domain-containing protein [Candidatus Omnitrophota bacterium]